MSFWNKWSEKSRDNRCRWLAVFRAAGRRADYFRLRLWTYKRLINTCVQYAFVLHGCDVMALCTASQISNVFNVKLITSYTINTIHHSQHRQQNHFIMWVSIKHSPSSMFSTLQFAYTKKHCNFNGIILQLNLNRHDCNAEYRVDRKREATFLMAYIFKLPKCIYMISIN